MWVWVGWLKLMISKEQVQFKHLKLDIFSWRFFFFFSFQIIGSRLQNDPECGSGSKEPRTASRSRYKTLFAKSERKYNSYVIFLFILLLFVYTYSLVNETSSWPAFYRKREILLLTLLLMGLYLLGWGEKVILSNIFLLMK